MGGHVLSFPKLGLEFTLRSEAFSLGPFTVNWYGIIIAAGFLLAMLYALKRSTQFGIDPDKLIDVTIGGTIGAIIGARLYYVVFAWNRLDHPLDAFKIWKGGIAIYGAVIGAFIAGYFMTRYRKTRFLPTADLASIGFLIGQAIGRWGNFFNIEAYGGNTSLPWGMYSDKIMWELEVAKAELSGIGMAVDPSVPVHPCFLYESLWCLIGFVLLHFLSKKRLFDGEVFLSYLSFYSFGRFFIEGLRTDSLMLGKMRVSQLLAALTFITAVTCIIIFRSRAKKGNMAPLYVTTNEWAAEYEKIEDNNKPIGKDAVDEAFEDDNLAENIAANDAPAEQSGDSDPQTNGDV